MASTACQARATGTLGSTGLRTVTRTRTRTGKTRLPVRVWPTRAVAYSGLQAAASG